jgi:hypothetical protein
MKTFFIRQYVKASALVLAIFLSGTFLQAQDIAGQWKGVVSFEGTNLHITFHINKTDKGHTSTLDNPEDGIIGFPVTTTTFDGSKLLMYLPDIEASYDGAFRTDSIVGVATQSGMSFPLTLKRVTSQEKPAVAP